MSQRNPMNERYTGDKAVGTTRKSAASAKPKTKAAASVTMGSTKKSMKEKKAEQKAARREEQNRQREIDRKYYKPDTVRYKKLRRNWWCALIGAIVCVAASFLLRGVQPEWIAMVALFLAYGLIIFAFYLDFSPIRKERKAYQDRMIALELEEARKKKQEENRQSGKNGKGSKNAKRAKGSSAASGVSNASNAANEKDSTSTEASNTDVKSDSGTASKISRWVRRKKSPQASGEPESEKTEAGQSGSKQTVAEKE